MREKNSLQETETTSVQKVECLYNCLNDKKRVNWGVTTRHLASGSNLPELQSQSQEK